MSSDEESEFFIGGVYSYVLDYNKKRSLTKYHGKLAHYRKKAPGLTPGAFFRSAHKIWLFFVMQLGIKEVSAKNHKQQRKAGNQGHPVRIGSKHLASPEYYTSRQRDVR